jgi:hypothetical protein
MSPEEARLADLSNHELIEELAQHALHGLPEELGVEVGLRLGVEGLHGIRSAAVPEVRTGEQAARLRRYAELWTGQPEAAYDAAIRARQAELRERRRSMGR